MVLHLLIIFLKYSISDGVPFVSVKDISNGYLDFSTCKYISEKEKFYQKIRANRTKKDDVGQKPSI